MSEEQQEVVVPGPGEILKKAREAANLSTQDIASKVRLKKTLIEELEQDNYDINISLTFIKGYLKLYAKQVKVPETVIVEAFEKHNTQKKEPAKLQSFSRRFSHQANDDKLMLVTYLIVAVVIALVVVWWFQKSDAANNVTSLLSTATKTEENKITSDSELESGANIPVSIKPETPVTQAPQVIEPVVQEASDITQELQTQEPAIADAVIKEPATELTSPESTLEAAVEELQQTGEEVVTTSAEVAANTLNSDAAPVELIFEFADNCWMNLADATGENIAYGVKVKGRVMAITGIPPFVVTLGAPEVVKINYAGEPVDMSFIAPGRSAKFDLPLNGTL
jgi:cytoskeleton protein RodZ